MPEVNSDYDMTAAAVITKPRCDPPPPPVICLLPHGVVIELQMNMSQEDQMSPILPFKALAQKSQTHFHSSNKPTQT